jgi:hypothetical protein
MELDLWDLAILVVAAFVAVISLVRLMLARRDEVFSDVQQQVVAAKAKRRKERE